jgi:hypothetical protein
MCKEPIETHTASATVRGLGSLAGAATRKGLHTFQVSPNPLDV